MSTPRMSPAVLAARVAAGSLPGVRRTPGLPSVALSRSVVVEADHVAAYARVCGFAPRDPVGGVVPATYPHVLAFPLHLELTTRRDFGFPALGLVHLDNEISVRRPVRVGDRLDLTARAEGLRSHRRGAAFDVVVAASVAGEPVWSGRSTYLARGPGDASLPRPPSEAGVTPGGVPWRLPGDLGRRYARASGDWNPIHLSVPSARLFGFRRPIAHGMWSLARCVAALENRVPPTVTVRASFRRPVLLPATTYLGEAGEGPAYAFGLFDPAGRPHLLGEISALEPG